MTDRDTLRRWMTLCEAQTGSYRLFHGTNADIDAFRFDDLQHRTGTPGTLAFTTSLTTARVYGKKFYEVVVTGTFGDYRNPEDVEKVFGWQFKIESSRDRSRMKPDPDRMDKIANRLRRDITKGNYDMWENLRLWQAMGWDGAWCFEPRHAEPELSWRAPRHTVPTDEGLNLIVGQTAHIQMVGLIK